MPKRIPMNRAANKVHAIKYGVKTRKVNKFRGGANNGGTRF